MCRQQLQRHTSCAWHIATHAMRKSKALAGRFSSGVRLIQMKRRSTEPIHSRRTVPMKRVTRRQAAPVTLTAQKTRTAFEAGERTELRCVGCRHCIFLRIDCDGPLMPCCMNPAARSFEHGLDVDAAACRLFEAIPAGTAYRLVNVESALTNTEQPTTRPKKDMHAALIGLAGLALLAIAVAKVVKVETARTVSVNDRCAGWARGDCSGFSQLAVSSKLEFCQFDRTGGCAGGLGGLRRRPLQPMPLE